MLSSHRFCTACGSHSAFVFLTGSCDRRQIMSTKALETKKKKQPPPSRQHDGVRIAATRGKRGFTLSTEPAPLSEGPWPLRLAPPTWRTIKRIINTRSAYFRLQNVFWPPNMYCCEVPCAAKGARMYFGECIFWPPNMYCCKVPCPAKGARMYFGECIFFWPPNMYCCEAPCRR